MNRLVLLACVLPTVASAGSVISGHQIADIDAGTGVTVAQEFVVGSDGGTTLTAAQLRWAREDLHLGVRIPYGAYRTPQGRDGSLGNLQIGGYYTVIPTVTVGLEVHANIGEGAWSWTNASSDLWPGAGARAVTQYRSEASGSLTWLARGALGVASARAVDPFPGTRLQFEAAGGLDTAIGDMAGFTTELSLRGWDTSPIDLAGLFRVDPIDGLRVRGGLLLPVGTWVGLSPSQRPAGAREATLMLDVAAYF
ncbi:MAG: hypothetical protein KC912_02535 [Proteobacteria bacterium]|nr:hypothetical protein [Pseudomonadota bacterium]